MQGSQGEAGVAGPQGETGAQGLRGPRGPQGKLAPPPTPPAPVGSVSGGDLGQAKTVDSLSITPTALTKVSDNGSQATWHAIISVKDNGSTSADVFCGDAGASLDDSQGRTYDGTSVVGESSANCGDNIQPGLTGSPYVMEFKLPTGAKPSGAEPVGGIDQDQSGAQVWNVGLVPLASTNQARLVRAFFMAHLVRTSPSSARGSQETKVTTDRVHCHRLKRR